MDDHSEYNSYIDTRAKWLEEKRTSLNRYVSMEDRQETCSIPESVIWQVEGGKMMTNWRGIGMCTDPLDIVLYQSLLYDVKPKTILEIGVLEGGTTLFLADTMKMYGLPCQVYAIDIDLNMVNTEVRQREDITLLQGDCMQIEETFTPTMLKDLPHPWVIIEDAHVNMVPVLEHFWTYMESGDYIVVEDCNPSISDDIMDAISDIQGTRKTWGLQKSKEVRRFAAKHPDGIRIDTFYNDRFGYNGTWNMNGFLRKM